MQGKQVFFASQAPDSHLELGRVVEIEMPIQAFWDDPEGILGDDLTGTVRDATVRPGSSSALEEVTLDRAPFLGIAADLRVPDGDTWRAVLPASQVRGRTLRITVTEGGIAVSSQ